MEKTSPRFPLRMPSIVPVTFIARVRSNRGAPAERTYATAFRRCKISLELGNLADGEVELALLRARLRHLGGERQTQRAQHADPALETIGANRIWNWQKGATAITSGISFHARHRELPGRTSAVLVKTFLQKLSDA